jgi:hypothetical protein
MPKRILDLLDLQGQSRRMAINGFPDHTRAELCRLLARQRVVREQACKSTSTTAQCIVSRDAAMIGGAEA